MPSLSLEGRAAIVGQFRSPGSLSNLASPPALHTRPWHFNLSCGLQRSESGQQKQKQNEFICEWERPLGSRCQPGGATTYQLAPKPYSTLPRAGVAAARPATPERPIAAAPIAHQPSSACCHGHASEEGRRADSGRSSGAGAGGDSWLLRWQGSLRHGSLGEALKGSPHDSAIFALALPAVVALAADPLLSIVGTAFVGRGGEPEALAALGAWLAGLSSAAAAAAAFFCEWCCHCWHTELQPTCTALVASPGPCGTSCLLL